MKIQDILRWLIGEGRMSVNEARRLAIATDDKTEAYLVRPMAGDVIVLQFRRRISDQEARALRQQLQLVGERAPGITVVVVENGEVHIVRAAPKDAPSESS